MKLFLYLAILFIILLGVDKMPKISVIIPAYNVEKYVEKTLKSLINQTFKDFEAIIINDGSTDNTEKIIKEVLQDTNFQWKLINRENQGVSAARNRGIIESKGEYLCFLDADDYYHPTFLEKMYNKAKEKSYDVVFCNYARVNEKGKIFSIHKQPKEFIGVVLNGKKTLELALESKLHIWTASYICRKDLIIDNNIFYTRGCPLGEDLEFWMKTLFHAEVVNNLPETLVYYVQRKGSSINRKQDLGVLHGYAMRKRLVSYVERAEATNSTIIDLMKKEGLKVLLHNLFQLYRSPKIDNQTLNNILQNEVIKDNLMKVKNLDLTISEQLFLFLLLKCPLSMRTINRFFINSIYKIKYRGYR